VGHSGTVKTQTQEDKSPEMVKLNSTREDKIDKKESQKNASMAKLETLQFDMIKPVHGGKCKQLTMTLALA
jgi:hypothetical protein